MFKAKQQRKKMYVYVISIMYAQEKKKSIA